MKGLKAAAERLVWGPLPERRKRGLLHFHDILQQSELAEKYFVTMGLLLGAIRDGAPIPWDRDFDFGFLDDDLPALVSTLHVLRAHGYGLRREQINNDGRTTKWAVKRKGVKYEFFLFEKHGANVRWFYHRRKPPLEIVNEVPWTGLAQIEIYGRRWLAPSNAEQVLTRIYGDWRTPNPGYAYWRDSGASVERRPWVPARRRLG